jgi:hypothetical protein
VRNGRADYVAGNRLGRALYAPVFDSPAGPPNSARFATVGMTALVNVPVGIALILVARRFLPETEPRPGRLDLIGALTSTGSCARQTRAGAIR